MTNKEQQMWSGYYPNLYWGAYSKEDLRFHNRYIALAEETKTVSNTTAWLPGIRQDSKKNG